MSSRPTDTDDKLLTEDFHFITALTISEPTCHHWAIAQSTDPDTVIVYDHQLNGRHRPTDPELRGSSDSARIIRSHWAHLLMENDLLFIKDDAHSQPQLVVPGSLVLPTLDDLHRELGHVGHVKTQAAVRQRFWLPRLREQVSIFSNTCPTCATFKGPKPRRRAPRRRAPLQSMATALTFERVGIDVIGHIPVTLTGNRYILVMIDYFTKWAEAVAIPRQDAASDTTALLTTWICRFGAPISLHSDCGANFESRLVRDVCDQLQIHKTHITPAHSEGKDQVERTNRTLINLLKVFAEDHNPHNWDVRLPYAMIAYRCTKVYFDQHVSGAPYAPGDLLLRYRPTPPVGTSSKFFHPWEGPLVVIDFFPPSTYTKRGAQSAGGPVLTVHYDKLEPYMGRLPNVAADSLPILPHHLVPHPSDEVEIINSPSQAAPLRTEPPLERGRVEGPEFLPSPTYAVPCDPPSEEEVADAIRKLRNNEAPGEDGIPAEIFKSCVDTLAPWLHEVIERAWRDEVVPDDWGLGILVPILKKGDKTRCENYRGISLIDVAAKIFAIVLLGRFQAVRDSRTSPNQAGFRAGRGCADQIFTLRRILEFRHSYQQPTAVCFVDFAAAFDSVHRESLWRIMALDGVPAKIIAMIKAYYHSTTARVLVRNNFSQPFGIRSGVRQGCILSPILFNYAIDWILGRALRDSDGVEFAPGHRLTDLDYADDIALLASSFGDLQSMVSRVNEVAKSVGLSINAGKTKVFSSCIPDQEKAPLGIDGCQLEEVDSFKYLGARLLPNGQSKDDIVSRIDAARWVFSSLRKCLWNRRDLSIATKIRVYRASVRSVLLYGCECWALRVTDKRKLEVFDHHCLRIILRVKLTDFVSNEIVRARCDNIARITQAIQERRLRWFGHVLRRPPQELSVTALDPAPLPHWRRRRGGQFKTWLDTVRQDMEVVLGPSVFGLRRWRREWVELSRSAAADRHAWRGTIRDIIEAG
nr:unnamed protein product [Spirometra erinaceieuropaei]